MRVASLLPLLCFAFAGVVPAFATGTLDCVADDASAAIDVHGIVPYGMGAPLLQVEAEITAPLPGLSEDVGTTQFDAEHEVQYWLDDVSLNLLFYKERSGNGPFAATTLVIKTTPGKAGEEGSYVGSYDIQGYEISADGDPLVVHARGMIECFAG